MFLFFEFVLFGSMNVRDECSTEKHKGMSDYAENNNKK